MSHLDPEQLALLALGEPAASVTDCSHLASCAACSDELAELTRTIRLARATVADDALESPPDRVWGAIADELGLGSAAAAADRPVEDGHSDDTTSDSDAADPSAPAGLSGAGADSPGTPRKRSRRMKAMWVLAASLAVVVGIGIGAWVTGTVLAPTSIAAASLDPFPDHPDATGTADVEEERDGTRRLIVSVDGDSAVDAYREVWLIRADAGALISLGVLEGDSGSFVIPEGVDLDEYRLVDVSVEPIDGDPAHSGDSIVRGELAQV